MDRKSLEARASALGIPFNANWKDETIAKKIAAVEANPDAPKTVGRPPASVRVRCLVDNVWLTSGKLRKGEEGDEGNPDALAVMIERGDVEKVK